MYLGRPASWKRTGTVHLPRLLAGMYILRAVTMPVVSPVDCTWADLDEALKLMSAGRTRCSNWMVSEIYNRDIRREPDTEKMPPMPRVYLYPEARQLFPSLPPQTIACLEQAMQKRYRELRYHIVWTRQRSLASFRYPTLSRFTCRVGM